MVAQPAIALTPAAMHKEHAFQASSPKNLTAGRKIGLFFGFRELRGSREIEPYPPALAFTRRQSYLADGQAGTAHRAMRPIFPQHAGTKTLAKTSPLEFIRQVRTETSKVTWPTRRETVMTGVMVVIMTTILAVFFFGVDSILQAIVTALLKLAQ
jgi:preprotein translocase subunit SecE